MGAGLVCICIHIYGNDGEFFILFLFFEINFNWRLIALQYCGGFCHTLT